MRRAKFWKLKVRREKPEKYRNKKLWITFVNCAIWIFIVIFWINCLMWWYDPKLSQPLSMQVIGNKHDRLWRIINKALNGFNLRLCERVNATQVNQIWMLDSEFRFDDHWRKHSATLSCRFWIFSNWSHMKKKNWNVRFFLSLTKTLVLACHTTTCLS